jgi:hypothetical protein
VENWLVLALQATKSVLKHLIDQANRLLGGFVGDNFSIEQIHDWREVKLFSRDIELCYVRYPLLIERCRCELAFQNIRGNDAYLALVRSVFLRPHKRFETQDSHQTLHQFVVHDLS